MPSEIKMATAGRCFCPHISRSLKRCGYPLIDAEPTSYWRPRELHRKYGYSIYSAGHGNVYTVPHLPNLAEEAQSAFEPQICRAKDGRFFDKVRPTFAPEAFETEAELRDEAMLEAFER